MSALMMEAARTSETLVKFYQITRRYNPEYSHLHLPGLFVETCCKSLDPFFLFEDVSIV
jgi:hypothetical protein